MQQTRILLTLALCLFVVSATAHEFSAKNSDSVSIRYATTSDSTVAVIQGGDYSGNVVIPDSVTENGTTYTVTRIAQYAFAWSGATSVVIPNTVTTIEDAAFVQCESITSVTIPHSITTIGNDVFSQCKRLASITIPNSVTTIGQQAFVHTALTTVTIPASVTNLDPFAFAYCFELTDIHVDAGNLNYSSIDGVLLNKLQTILLSYPAGKPSTSYTTPTTVTIIENAAFLNCNALMSITLSHSVMTIREYAFAGCEDLLTITLGNSVNMIHPEAFVECNVRNINVDAGNPYYSSNDGVLFDKPQTTLICYPKARRATSYTIPNNTINIGEGAFRDCYSLRAVNIPNSVKTIGNYAFYYCRYLTSVTSLHAVTTIGNDAFSQCYDLTSVAFDSIKTIGNYAFQCCYNLTSLTLPNSLTTIESYAFQYCNGLTSLILPNSLKTIEEGAFAYCSNLTSLILGDSVTNIERDAFTSCISLKSLIIPNSVTTIGSYAFRRCAALDSINVKTLTPPQLASYVFNDIPTHIPVHVPCGALAAYQASDWGIFTNIIDDIMETATLIFHSNDTTKGVVTQTQANSCQTNHQAILSANANAGYRFVQWNDGNKDNPRTVDVLKNMELIATFVTDAAGIYYVSVLTNDPAMGTVSGSGEFAASTTATITAVPNKHYRFVQWDDGITINPRSITVTQDTIFTAKFEELPTHYVEIWAEGSGYIDGGGIFNRYWEDDTIIAVAVPYSGFRFIGWSDGSMDNPHTIIVGQEMYIYSIFAADMEGMYYIEAFPNHTDRGDVSGGGCYPKDTTIYITATANPESPIQSYKHSRFIRWSDGVTLNPRPVTVTEDMIFVAEFEWKQFYYCNIGTSDPSKGTIIENSWRGPWGYYVEGDTIIATAVPELGCRFVCWSDGSTINPRTIILAPGIIDLTAIFIDDSLGMCHVTTLMHGSVFNSVTGGGYYSVGDTVTIFAQTFFWLYRFVCWNDGDTNNPRAFIITQDTIFTAAFVSNEQGLYYASIWENDLNMGTVSGRGSYNEYTQAMFYANPYTGYRFVQWNDGVTDNPRTITVTQDTFFLAEFEAYPNYLLSLTANDLTMGTVSDGGVFPDGTVVNLWAIPHSGYRFVRWNDGVTANVRAITLTQDTTLEAEFAVISFYRLSLTANDTAMGTLIGEGVYVEQSVATICATPKPWHRFLGWTDGVMDSLREITLTRDTLFTAQFEVIPTYQVRVLSNDTTKGSVSGGGTFLEDDLTTIVATPNMGYRFICWSDGSTDSLRTITVRGNVTYIAEFSIEATDIFHISTWVQAEHMGFVSGGGDYPKDSIAVITATAYSGYRFVCWDDGDLSASRSIKVTQDRIFIAEFEVGGVGVAQTQLITSLRVYPNPTRNNITVALPENITNAVFSLYDLQGRSLLLQSIENGDVISVENLSAGMYMYSVLIDGKRQQGKLSIIR